MYWLKIILWIGLGLYLIVNTGLFFALFGGYVGFSKNLSNYLVDFQKQCSPLQLEWEMPPYETLYKANRIERQQDTLVARFDSVFIIRRYREIDAEYVYKNRHLMPPLHCILASQTSHYQLLGVNNTFEESEEVRPKKNIFTPKPEVFLYFENPNAPKNISEMWENTLRQPCEADDVFLLKISPQDSLSNFVLAHYTKKNNTYILEKTSEGVLQDLKNRLIGRGFWSKMQNLTDYQ